MHCQFEIFVYGLLIIYNFWALSLVRFEIIFVQGQFLSAKFVGLNQFLRSQWILVMIVEVSTSIFISENKPTPFQLSLCWEVHDI